MLAAAALTMAACGQGADGGQGASFTTLAGGSTTAAPGASTATTTSPTPSSTSSATHPSTTAAPTATTSTSSQSGAATPAEAIEVWMDGQGFVYAGECATTTIEDDLGKYCSSLCEERGTSQIHKIGPTFSEYTTWLLLERSGGVWSLTDTAEDTGTAPAPW